MRSKTRPEETPLAERSPHRLRTHGIRWWLGYQRTVGLDAFRTDERYAAWLHTHRGLLAEDLQYAADTRWYWLCLLLAAGLSCCVWAYVGFLSTALTFGLASAILLVYREQRRRNVAIAERLKVRA